MIQTRAGFVAISLLILCASCGKPLPSPGEPPPDAPPGTPPDASPGGPPDAPLPPEEICGDGDVDLGEECDTGGASATCDVDCTAPACGDGTLNPAAGEQCDDGNAVAGDGCTVCRRDCGNGTLDANEECDAGDADGNGFADPTAECDSDCTAPACGDGSFNPIVEETCDDGNDVSADGCSAGCVSEISVVGIFHAEIESLLSGLYRFDGTHWQLTTPLASFTWFDDHWAAGPLDDYVVGSIANFDLLPSVQRGDEALFHRGSGVPDRIELEGMLGEGLVSFSQIWGTGTEPVTLYVITDRYDLLRYDATGWARVEFPRPLDVIDVWGTGPDDVYVFDWNGNRFHFDGTSWTEVDDLPAGRYHVMGGTGPNDMLVAGDDSVARFDGNQWTQWTLGLEDLRVRSVASSGDGSFAVIDTSRVAIFDEGEWSYFDFTGQVEFNDMTMLPNGHVFAVGGTLVFHYDGQDWDIQDVAPPEPPLYGQYGPLRSIQFAPGNP